MSEKIPVVQHKERNEGSENVERAKELYEAVKEYHEVVVEGADAMLVKHKVDEMAAQLKEVLKSIPATACLDNGLPYHPLDEKYSAGATPFPAEPDYPVGENNPQPSGDDERTDITMVANDNRPPQQAVA